MRLAVFLVVAVAGALYARTTRFGFTFQDDDILIVDQLRNPQTGSEPPAMRSVQQSWTSRDANQQRALAQPGSIGRAFTQTYLPTTGRDHAYYRPLANASFAATARFGGGAASHHAVNVALHMLAAGLLFALLGRLGHRPGVALLGGLLFAVHPALTEAVAWIPGRNDLLLVVAALAAWLALLRGRAPRRFGSRLVHPLLWLAALASKETAIVLPLVWVAHARVVDRRPLREILRPWLLVGWGVALAIYLVARAKVVPAGLGAGGLSLGHAVRNLGLIPASLGKLLFAWPLAVLATPADTPLWPGLVATALAIAALVAVPGTRRSQALFALGAFVAFIAPGLPASNLLTLESRLYLPAIAFVLFVCALAEAWRAPRAAPLAAGLVVAGLAIVALRYSASFRDRMTFAEAAVRGSPHSSLAHRNLGVAHHFAGDLEAARRAYLAAIAQDAAEPIVHNNLAVIYMAGHQLHAAETELRAEIAINPGYAPAHRNLAQVLHGLGRDGEAILEAHEAAALGRR